MKRDGAGVAKKQPKPFAVSENRKKSTAVRPRPRVEQRQERPIRRHV
jgi:hypothetical protein